MKKIIVITGASSGLGKEFAIQLDKKEKVDEFWVIARRLDRLNELKDKLSTPIKTIPLDISKRENILSLEEIFKKEDIDIKILVNAAGFGKFNHYENIDKKDNQDMIDLNVSALVGMVDISLPYMKEGSKIINIASCAGFQPIPYINIYASTKAFVLSYSRALKQELKYRDISVTAVCPYWTKTEFFDRAVMKKEKPVIINYGVMYNSPNVVKKAIKDAYKNKELSVYGKTNNFQWILTKMLNHKLVMKAWMKRQKFNGTKDIR